MMCLTEGDPFPSSGIALIIQAGAVGRKLVSLALPATSRS